MYDVVNLNYNIILTKRSLNQYRFKCTPIEGWYLYLMLIIIIIQICSIIFVCRWQQMTGDLHDRLSMFEACFTQWQQYEQECNKARRWLDAKERLCNELVAIKEDSSRRDECLQESKVNFTFTVCYKVWICVNNWRPLDNLKMFVIYTIWMAVSTSSVSI